MTRCQSTGAAPSSPLLILLPSSSQAGREALERVIGQAQAALDKLAESSGLCLAVTRRNAQEVGW